MDGPAEDEVAGGGARSEEAAGVILVRVRAPQLLGEVCVVVVDEDHGAFRHFLAWKKHEIACILYHGDFVLNIPFFRPCFESDGSVVEKPGAASII